MKNPTKHAQKALQATQQAAPVSNDIQITYEYKGYKAETKENFEMWKVTDEIKEYPFQAAQLPMPKFEQVAYAALEDVFETLKNQLVQAGYGDELLMVYSSLAYACAKDTNERTPSDIDEMQRGIMSAWGKTKTERS